MAQIIINTGAAANDGTGDPLRTAFTETNLNFDQIFAAGPVLSNVQIVNNTILTTNTNGNLVLAPNGTGRVIANVDVIPDSANIRNLGGTTKRWSTLYTQYLDVSAGVALNGNLTVGGNLTVSGDIIEMGNIVTDALTIQLANTAANAASADGAGVTVGASDDIATLLYDSAGNVWTTNIGLSAAGNITAPYFIGNGSQLTGVTNYANVNAVAYGQAGWAGNIIPGGNAVYSLGNATNQWSDLYVSNATIYMNGIAIGLTAGNVLTVNGEDVLSNNSNASISTTGNITADYFLGNVSQATGLPVIPANISAFNNDSGYITANVTGNISATGNVSGSYILGNGSQLTGLPVSYTNANVVSLLSAFGSNTISTTGNVTTGKFSGSTAVIAGLNTRGEHAANLGVSGFTELNANVVVQTTGNANGYTQFNFQNINDGNRATTDFIATAAFGTDSTYFVDMGIAGGQYDSSNPDNSLGNSLYPQDSYLYAQGGNSPGGSGGNLVVGSNEPGGVVRIIANGSTTDNIVATFSNVGINVSGDVNATGNVTSTYVKGNGSELTNLPAPAVAQDITSVGNMSIMTYDGALKYVSYATVEPSSGNIAGGNISATGNITGGNIITAGNMSGNTAGFAIGYRDIPQISFTGNATIATTDAGKHFYSTQSTNYTLTISNNASQGFQVGAAITVVNQGTGTITIAQGSGVTLYLAGNATAGNRSVSTFGMATIMKVATNTWFINGTGVS